MFTHFIQFVQYLFYTLHITASSRLQQHSLSSIRHYITRVIVPNYTH